MRFKAKLIAVLIFFGVSIVGLTGCKFTDWLSTETGATVVQEAGELAGMVIGFENQAAIEDMVKKVDILLIEPDEYLKKAALEEAYSFVYHKYGHNVQTAYLVSKANKLIGIVFENDQLKFLANYKIEALDSFLLAFRNGLITATPRYNKVIVR